jgi:hypothetical protein
MWWRRHGRGSLSRSGYRQWAIPGFTSLPRTRAESRCLKRSCGGYEATDLHNKGVRRFGGAGCQVLTILVECSHRLRKDISIDIKHIHSSLDETISSSSNTNLSYHLEETNITELLLLSKHFTPLIKDKQHHHVQGNQRIRLRHPRAPTSDLELQEIRVSTDRSYPHHKLAR